MIQNATNGSSECAARECSPHHLFHHSLILIFLESSPIMIEIAGRLAGGRKAIMAEATIPGWHPFEAMIDAHCGFPIRMPASFKPTNAAAQAYIASDKNGILKSVRGSDFERLPTHRESTMLCKVGDKVKRARDLMSFAAYVWLIGEAEDVKRDALRAREEFVVEVETAE